MADYQFLNLSVEDKLCFIKINRPPVNALGMEILEEMDKAMDALAKDPEVTDVPVVANPREPRSRNGRVKRWRRQGLFDARLLHGGHCVPIDRCARAEEFGLAEPREVLDR